MFTLVAPGNIFLVLSRIPCRKSSICSTSIIHRNCNRNNHLRQEVDLIVIVVYIGSTYILNYINSPFIEVHHMFLINTLTDLNSNLQLICRIVRDCKVTNQFKHRLIGTCINNCQPPCYIEIICLLRDIVSNTIRLPLASTKHTKSLYPVFCRMLCQYGSLK